MHVFNDVMIMCLFYKSVNKKNTNALANKNKKILVISNHCVFVI